MIGRAPAPEAVLDALSVPWCLCDSNRCVTAASEAFVELTGRGSDQIVGRPLGELLGQPDGGCPERYDAPDGRSLVLQTRLLQTGDELVVLASGEAPPRASSSLLDEQAVSLLVRLTRRLILPMRDEELVQLFAEAYQSLLPGRLLCLRLVDPATHELLQVYATGRLIEDGRSRVVLSKHALASFGGPAHVGEGGVVGFGDSYVLVFEGARAGFDVPLHDGRQLLGVLAVEYTDPPVSVEADRLLAWSVSLHLSTALRNARLLGESMYLRNYLDNLLDNANAPIVVTDRDRRIKVVNRAFEQLTGWNRTDVLDKDVLKLLPKSECDRFLPAIINALRGESTRSLELRVPRKSGGHARLAFSTAAVTSGYGEIVGVVAIGQDMTELRQLQQQIIHSEKLATLGQLAAGVVHELNNPLTSISVYSEYLLKKMEREGGDSADRVKLARICEGAERILRFTRDLVVYARPAGEEPRLVDLRDVVERSLVFCEHVIAAAGAEVSTDFEEPLPSIYGLKGQLQQVVVNLVTNACDAMPRGAGRLDVAVRTVGDRVRLSLTDNGPGIPAEQQESIFEPFFSTKAEGKGTGLGLSIVRNIITNHNGSIAVERADGGGTTFHVELFAGG